jgi:AmmeMemoRadiSam system protein B
MDVSVRDPAVAGMFYPASGRDLEREVHRLTPPAEGRHELLACIAPHAGYVYSGGVAGAVFGHLEVPPRVILVGPNHTGAGARVAVAPHHSWRMPDGLQPVDRSLGARLCELAPIAEEDGSAHWREHSLEVQIPFLRARQPDLRIAAICLGHLSLDECVELGDRLAELVSQSAEPIGLVASSDMSHYVPDGEARRLDQLAIDAAVAREPATLYDVVRSNGISMCGVVPATVVIEAANRLGAIGAHLVAYATSGDVSGDRNAVVGYAGICIHH